MIDKTALVAVLFTVFATVGCADDASSDVASTSDALEQYAPTTLANGCAMTAHTPVAGGFAFGITVTGAVDYQCNANNPVITDPHFRRELHVAVSLEVREDGLWKRAPVANDAPGATESDRLVQWGSAASPTPPSRLQGRIASVALDAFCAADGPVAYRTRASIFVLADPESAYGSHAPHSRHEVVSGVFTLPKCPSR